MVNRGSPLRVGVLGGSGRMGREVVKQVWASSSADLVSVIVRKDNTLVGSDAGVLLDNGAITTGVTISADLELVYPHMDVLIDFTTPECGLAALYHGGKNNVGHVIGTTGFSAAQQNILADYSKNVPIVFSSNMSICVNLLLALVEKVAASLDNSYDIEISEMHHRDKLDAPSGTAIAIGKAAAIGRDVQFHEVAILSGHYGMGIKRPEGRIGFSSQRGGKVIGSHSVSFMGDSDVLTMSHSAMDRSIYSKGALLAAAWLRGKPPGLYSMRDVLSNVKELF